MTQIRTVRVSPSEMTQPITTPFPADKARRWDSPYDDSGLEPLVPIFLTPAGYQLVCDHSGSDLQNEVGGVLVGQWCLDDNHRQFIIVEHALPARHTRHGSAYLTFTQDSLVDIHNQIDADYKGQTIVGWYHTHPGMGIFLSHYDTWLHRNFFPEPWQVALVVEPVSASGGFFVRQRQGLLDPTRYFGFYELDGADGPSTMYWTNLHRLEHDKGEVPNE